MVFLDKEAELTKPKAYTYECEECHKHFNDIKNFRRHKKTMKMLNQGSNISVFYAVRL